jgi:hypothetical protein
MIRLRPDRAHGHFVLGENLTNARKPLEAHKAYAKAVAVSTVSSFVSDSKGFLLPQMLILALCLAPFEMHRLPL